MKKILFLAICMLAVVACKNENASKDVAVNSQVDSLQKIIMQKDSELNDIMATFNEIEDGLRQISEAEDRVSLAKDGEGADKAQRIRENVQFIQSRMAQNRALITKLRQQLRESSYKGEELKRTLDNITEQLNQKEAELQKLREELDKKDIHIAELDETINNLNSDVATLTEEGERKSKTIDTQDKQLNTAWYVFGTKEELKEQGIYEKNKVLQSNFNKNYFTKIDIRVEKEIKLYSKSARMLTTHPSSSYTLTPDANKQYVLRITNPQLFWSTSKYLVILVK